MESHVIAKGSASDWPGLSLRGQESTTPVGALGAVVMACRGHAPSSRALATGGWS